MRHPRPDTSGRSGTVGIADPLFKRQDRFTGTGHQTPGTALSLLSSGTAVPSLEPLAQTNLAVLDLGLGVGQSGLYKEIDYSPLSQLPDLVCLNLTNHTRVTTKLCKQILAHSPDLRFLNIQNTPASEGSALDVEYLRAYTEADLLKRLANKLRNTFG